MVTSNTIDDQEIASFSRLGDDWNTPGGSFHLLQKLNECRIESIIYGMNTIIGSRLSGTKILDVGCGGGFLSFVIIMLYSFNSLAFG